MRINNDDDLVVVKEVKTGDIWHKGYDEDDELQREDWKYNEKQGHYELTFQGIDLIKIKLL